MITLKRLKVPKNITEVWKERVYLLIIGLYNSVYVCVCVGVGGGGPLLAENKGQNKENESFHYPLN